MKKIAIIWGLTVLVVFGSLTFFGFKYQEVKEYKKLETKMVYYTKKYINRKKDLDLKSSEIYKVSLDELKAYQPKVNFTVKNDTCSGYVNVKKTLIGHLYKAHLKCKEY